MSTTALVVVDVQNDFVEGGSLGVDGGQRLAGLLSSLVVPVWADNVQMPVVFTKDWHIDPGEHFSEDPDYQDSWPEHCVAETEGAEFASEFPQATPENTFRKGQYQSSYSGTEGVNIDGVGLSDHLQDLGVDNVEIVGIAFDYCVRQTALALREDGFNVRVVKYFTASVHPENDAMVIHDLEAAGVQVHITKPFAGTLS